MFFGHLAVDSLIHLDEGVELFLKLAIDFVVVVVLAVEGLDGAEYAARLFFVLVRVDLGYDGHNHASSAEHKSNNFVGGVERVAVGIDDEKDDARESNEDKNAGDDTDGNTKLFHVFYCTICT